LGPAVGLAALVLAFLLILSGVSKETTIWGYNIRKMDILSDIRPKITDSVGLDTLASLPLDTLGQQYDTTTLAAGDADSLMAAERIPVPTAPSTDFGQKIEDYTFQQHGMSRFYTAIDSIRSHGAKVRVAFFGDSFVEGDILLGDMRDTLQAVWGGGGVGFVPITSEVARFRRSFIQEYNGFHHISMLKPEGIAAPLGINGYAYFPNADARVRYKGTTQYALRRTAYWDDVRLFYKANQAVQFNWETENRPATTVSLPASTGMLSMWQERESQMGGCTFRFPQPEGLTLYGASLEAGPGIYFDNFSVRGNSGGKLCNIKPEMVRAFDRFQQYDLVILQFGLNAVTNSLVNIKWYQAELEKTFVHIRRCFPNTPILVMSVPDRGGKVNGELATMVSVPHIVQMQRELARQHGFLFYDFFYGMGGPGTMVRLSAQRKPTLVNSDYTHLTHEGGRMVGLRMAELFLRGKQ
jgi:hypothetical protein